MAFADYCYQCHMLWTCKDHTANQFEPIKAQKWMTSWPGQRNFNQCALFCGDIPWILRTAWDSRRQIIQVLKPSFDPTCVGMLGLLRSCEKWSYHLWDFLGFVDPFVSLSSSPLDITMSLLIISPLRGSTYTHREKQPEEETDDRAMRACWWPRVNSRLQATTPSRRPCLPLHLQAFASHVSLNSSDENSGFYWLFAQPAKSFLFCIEDSWLPLGFTSQIS